MFTGGTRGTDFTLAESGSGVSLSGSSVVFTGPADSTATVEVTAASAAVLSEKLTVAPGEVAVTGASLAATDKASALVGDGVVFTGAAPKPEPVPVTVARTDSGPISEATGAADRTATFTVSLGRVLVAGETVDVPLMLSGSGIAAADVSLSFTSGETNMGVSLRGVSSMSPVLRFVGAGAQVASVTITASDDSVDEGTAETLTVALGDLAAAGLATNVAGGTAAGAGANSFDVVITDDDMAGLVAVVVGDGLGASPR